MAQARRKSIGTARRKLKHMPGWALLIFGLVVGVAGVLLVQLVTKRLGSNDGLVGLMSGPVRSKARPAESGPVPPARHAAPHAKPKFDFYTILPEVETVLPEKAEDKPARPSKPEEGVRYVLQVASFPSYRDADQLKARLALNGLVAHIQKVTIEGKGEYHRVRLGPYRGIEELDTVNKRLKEMGIRALRLKVEKSAGV